MKRSEVYKITYYSFGGKVFCLDHLTGFFSGQTFNAKYFFKYDVGARYEPELNVWSIDVNQIEAIAALDALRELEVPKPTDKKQKYSYMESRCSRQTQSRIDQRILLIDADE